MWDLIVSVPDHCLSFYCVLLVICLFILHVFIFYLLLFLLVSGLAAVCGCGTIWTFLLKILFVYCYLMDCISIMFQFNHIYIHFEKAEGSSTYILY